MCVGVSIARTGEQIYGEGETPLETDDDGVVGVHRHEREVFCEKTIASFEGKPITITHPTDFVTPTNWARLAKGTMQNVRRGEGALKNDLIADLLITDELAINLVKNGLREVSCGYEADYVQTGEGKGKQLNIRGNHLALVEKGRAGSGYAIHDHDKIKGDNMSKKKPLKERIAALFAKAQDEAMKMADEDGEEGGEKKEKKADDEKTGDSTLADVMEAISALTEKVKALEPEPKKDDAPAADEDEGEKKPKKKKDDASDEGEESESEPTVEERLKVLEASVAKILELLSDEDEEESEEESESEDADEDDDKESEDEKGSLVGDTASRVEILAPGLKAKAKDAKSAALKAFAATAEGKKVMASLTGGAKLTFDSADRVNALFIAASEIMKTQRSSDLSDARKKARANDFDGGFDKGPMTPERMNEINAKHYNKR